MKLTDPFIRHAGKISGGFYLLQDVLLVLKDYFQNHHLPNRAEQAAGSIFVATDICLALSDRYPAMKFGAGASILAGAATLGYSGMGSAGQNSQLAACSLIAAQGLALIFEKSLQKFHGTKSNHSVLAKAFTPLTKYPVLTTSAVDMAGHIVLAVAAIQKKDAGLFAAATAGFMGGAGLLMTDNNVKKALGRPISPELPSPLPPAA